MAGRRNKVTARFVDIADLAREAHYAAKAADEHVVRAEHVRKALSSKMERHNLIETRIREMIEKGRCWWMCRASASAGKRAKRAGDWRIFVRQAGADYGDGGVGKIRPH